MVDSIGVKAVQITLTRFQQQDFNTGQIRTVAGIDNKDSCKENPMLREHTLKRHRSENDTRNESYLLFSDKTKQQNIIFSCLMSEGVPMTNNEIAEKTRIRISSVTARMNELRNVLLCNGDYLILEGDRKYNEISYIDSSGCVKKVSYPNRSFYINKDYFKPSLVDL